jgi:hypothetical protein
LEGVKVSQLDNLNFKFTTKNQSMINMKITSDAVCQIVNKRIGAGYLRYRDALILKVRGFGRLSYHIWSE